jgi:hypothetical protein
MDTVDGFNVNQKLQYHFSTLIMIPLMVFIPREICKYIYFFV